MNWTRVKDKTPEETGRYLCIVLEVTDLGISRFAWNCSYNANDDRWNCNAMFVKVTHWMPIPELPEEYE